MAYDREPRSVSPDGSRSPRGHRRRSRSLSKSRRSRSRSRDASLDVSRDVSRHASRDEEDVENPGNNLYVTGLSPRVTCSELEKFFSKEGKVIECQVVTDPHTKESRGFGFVTMETTDEAENCIQNLNRAVLEGRLITIQKAKRKRGRTPTPGKYQGQQRDLRDKRDGRQNFRRRSRSYSPRRRFERDPYPYDRRFERDPYPVYPRGREPPRFFPSYGGNRRPDVYPSYGGYSRRADDYPSSYRRRGPY